MGLVQIRARDKRLMIIESRAGIREGKREDASDGTLIFIVP